MDKINFALKLAYGIFIGWLVWYCSDTFVGLYIAILYGALLGTCFLQLDFWKKRCLIVTHQYIGLLKEDTKKSIEALCSNVKEMAEHYYKDTPIQNYVVQFAEDKLTLKVGDDEYMVSVDMEILKSDAIAALEQASIEWMSKNKGDDDEDKV